MSSFIDQSIEGWTKDPTWIQDNYKYKDESSVGAGVMVELLHNRFVVHPTSVRINNSSEGDFVYLGFPWIEFFLGVKCKSIPSSSSLFLSDEILRFRVDVALTCIQVSDSRRPVTFLSLAVLTRTIVASAFSVYFQLTVYGTSLLVPRPLPVVCPPTLSPTPTDVVPSPLSSVDSSSSFGPLPSRLVE